jgi:hypothetical protein
MEAPAAKPTRWKKIIRRIVFVLAAFVTLCALFFAEENWRGARAWQNYKREREAKGDRFDAARLIPPKVPDDQNLAMIPFLATGNTDKGPMTGLADQFSWPEKPPHPMSWRYGFAEELTGWAKAFGGPSADPAQAASTVFDYLQAREPVLAELTPSVRQRSYCRFNIRYENWQDRDVEDSTMQQFARIKQLIRLLSLRAQAELVMGRTDQALDDINVLFRIDGGLKNEPLLISQLVRIAGLSILMQPVGEGLAEHRWSDAQLRVLQEQLQTAGVIDSLVRAMYGERDICYNPAFDLGMKMPRGWSRFEQVNINSGFQDAIFPRIDLAAMQINPSVNHAIDLTWRKQHAETGLGAVLRHGVMVKMLLPAYFAVPQQFAFAQTEVDMGALACALERFRLAHSQYPEDLQALVPGFVTVLPHDIINGQPLTYHRTDDGRFILYSVGWNEKDDGGVTVARASKTNEQDVLSGDWVWEYPKKP